MNNYEKTIRIRECLEMKNILHHFEEKQKGIMDCFYMDFEDGSRKVTMVLAIDDKYEVMTRYIIAKIMDDSKRGAVLELLNELNDKRKVKYYLGDDGYIVAENIFMAENEEFNEGLVVEWSIGCLMKIVQNEYAEIMRVLWS